MNNLKQRLSVAVQSPVKPQKNVTVTSWYYRSRTHLLVYGDPTQGSDDPLTLSASYILYLENGGCYVSAYDPLTFMDMYSNIEPADSYVIFIYDLQILGDLPEYRVYKFISCVKHLLMFNVRVVMSVPSGLDIKGFDTVFSNKKVAGVLLKFLTTFSITKIEV